ncbi:uncharacterized protein LOC129253258 [Anastrepha obliqua]|uniref:uncharacterized protein LOC129253258 n=1 Tax=Anastrepha obliqua TaxID=95512 RepID=UPI00240A431B|nr:uncharacterized protein LOC129253258 [Anastrepha obliqua]
MQRFSNITTILNLIGLSVIGQEFIQTLTDIVIATSLERRVDTVLYTSYENETTLDSANVLQSSIILSALARELPQPLLHFDSASPVECYKKMFNAELLTIAKLNQHSEFDDHLLVSLWQRLWRNTQSRLILLFDDSASEAYVTRIFRMCVKHHATNVIALQPLMTVVERNYWALRLFPAEKVTKETFPVYYEKIFIDHLQNMYGHPLSIIDFTVYPQIYYYESKDGAQTLSGFLGRSLTEYASHCNATKEYPLTSINKNLTSFADFVHFLQSEIVNIGSIVPIEAVELNISLSIVFELTDWCLMVPVEQPLPKSTFYYIIVKKSAVILFCGTAIFISCFWAFTYRWRSSQQKQLSIIDYFFNVLQGLMGASFWISESNSAVQSVIHLTISSAGIIIGIAYGAYLQSFIVDVPLAAPMKTMDDLLTRGITVTASSVEISFLQKSFEFTKYFEKFTFIDDFNEFQSMRDSLNPRYAFTVTDMWAIYDERQKYFSRPLFRLSDICLGKSHPMILTLQENSLHQERLNIFILRLHEVGLIGHWWRQTFWEFLAMDFIYLEDENKQPGFEPMELEDLRIVLIAMSALITLSIFCFVLEVFWERIHKFLIPISNFYLYLKRK